MSKIILMGDSITAYMPKNLIGIENDEVKIFGYENMCCETYHLYCWPTVKSEEADIYVLLIGINNILMPDMDSDKPDTLEDIIKKIEDFINDISSNNVPLIMQSLYPTKYEQVNKQVKYVNKRISDFCKEYKVEYLDLYSDLCDETGLLNKKYSNDGLHPNQEGYEIITPIINKTIKLLLQKQKNLKKDNQ